jgi:hypothetical protein
MAQAEAQAAQPAPGQPGQAPAPGGAPPIENGGQNPLDMVMDVLSGNG